MPYRPAEDKLRILCVPLAHNTEFHHPIAWPVLQCGAMTSRRLQMVLALVTGVLAAFYSYGVYRMFEKRWNYLTWDPAAHGWDGMRLALDVRELDIPRLILDTNQLVLWPPLHSYLQIPYFLFFGFEYSSSVLCSLTFLALFPMVLTWLYHQLNPIWSGWLLLMVFVVASPTFLGFGAMPMLEIFGAVFTAWSAALFLRRSYWFPLSLALLFFLKYNYFFYVLLAVMATSSRTDFQAAVRYLRQMRILLWPAVIFCVVALLILITGGYQIGSWSIRGIGNPAYIFFVLSIALLVWKKQHLFVWEQIRRSGWKWFMIPVLLWMIIPIPNRVKTILSFAINRPLGSPPASSLDYYLFYLERIAVYFSAEWIAWVAIGISAFVVFRYHRMREVRFVAGLFVLPFLLMTLNQNKQDRFLFTFLPALWLLVAFGISHIRWKGVQIATVLALIIGIGTSFHSDPLRAVVRSQFVALRMRAPLHFIAERIATAKEVRVLGTNNELSPAMIQYHSARGSDFQIDKHFQWEIEKRPETDLHIICIDCEPPGTPVKARMFPRGLVIRHSFLDTPEGAPYNPDLVAPASRRQ